MATEEEKLIRLRIDAGEAESSIQSLAGKFLNKGVFETAGQVAAFGGLGYGAYRLATSEIANPHFAAGMGALNNAAHTVTGTAYNPNSRGGFVYNTAGDAFRGTPENGLPHNLVSSHTSYYGMRDFTERGVSSGLAFAGAASSVAAPIAAGSLLSGLGVTQALGTAGKVAGGTFGGGILSGGINLAGGALAKGAGGLGFSGAASAITKGTEFVAGGAGKAGTLVGGFAGAAMPAILGGMVINKITDTVLDNIASQMSIENTIDEIDHTFTPGMATNVLTGRGLHHREQTELAENIRESLVEQTFMRQDDFNEILRGINEGDLLYNVRGAEEFGQRFKEVTESLKEISKVYTSSLGEAAELLGEMKRSGFYTTADQTEMLMVSDAIGRMTGRTGEEIIQIGQSGADISRQHGIGGAVGYELSTNALQMLYERENQLDDFDRQEFINLREELGGDENISQQATQFAMNLANRQPSLQTLFGFVDPENDRIDQESLNAFLQGEQSYIDAFSQGSMRAGTSPGQFANFQNNANQYYEQLDDYQMIQFMQRIIEGIHETSGRERMGIDYADTFRQLGVTDPKTRQVFEDIFIHGPETYSKTQLELEVMDEQVRQERAETRSFSGWSERNIKQPLERLGYELGSPFVSGYQTLSNLGNDFIEGTVKGIDRVSIDGKPIDTSISYDGESGYEWDIALQKFATTLEEGVFSENVGYKTDIDRNWWAYINEPSLLVSDGVNKWKKDTTFSEQILKLDEELNKEDRKIWDLFGDREFDDSIKLGLGILQENKDGAFSFDGDNLEEMYFYAEDGTKLNYQNYLEELGLDSGQMKYIEELMNATIAQREHYLDYYDNESAAVSEFADYSDKTWQSHQIFSESALTLKSFDDDYNKIMRQNMRELSSRARHQSKNEEAAELFSKFAESEKSFADRMEYLYDDDVLETTDGLIQQIPKIGHVFGQQQEIGEMFFSGELSAEEAQEQLEDLSFTKDITELDHEDFIEEIQKSAIEDIEQLSGHGASNISRLRDATEDTEVFKDVMNELLAMDLFEVLNPEGDHAVIKGKTQEDHDKEWERKAEKDYYDTMRDNKETLDNLNETLSKIDLGEVAHLLKETSDNQVQAALLMNM